MVTRGEGGRVKSILCTTQFCSCAESKGPASRGGGVGALDSMQGVVLDSVGVSFSGCLFLRVFVSVGFFILLGFDSVGV